MPDEITSQEKREEAWLEMLLHFLSGHFVKDNTDYPDGLGPPVENEKRSVVIKFIRAKND